MDIARILTASDPRFITGVEFNSEDDRGKYHILGYGYDPGSDVIEGMIQKVRNMRMMKVTERVDGLKSRFGIEFPSDEVEALMALYNPGKPHIANLMVKYGYVSDKTQAIKDYIDKIPIPNSHIDPKSAIEGIIKAGGIPVLAHPPYGSGDEMILGDELDERVRKMISYGLRGVEGFYSQYTNLMCRQVLEIAEKYDLYVSAGSDYHGKNKLVILGDTGLENVRERPRGLIRFIELAQSLLTEVG